MGTSTDYRLDGVVTDVGTRAAHDTWRDWCSMVHGEFNFDFRDPTYQGQTRRQRTDTFELVSWTSEQEYVRRDRRGIKRDPRGHYELVLPLKNTLYVGSDEANIPLTPGQMALLPIDMPFHLAHEDGFAGLMLLIPYQRIDDRLGTEGHRSNRVVADQGLGRITRDLLTSLVRERDNITGEDFDFAVDRAVDLVCVAAQGGVSAASRSGDHAVLADVRSYIRAHAVDPEFSVQAMASTIGWSPRYIQAVLSRAGLSASELARTERLELARLRLASPAFDNYSIADVATSVGFTSPSAFASAFRRHFGSTPREFRT